MLVQEIRFPKLLLSSLIAILLLATHTTAAFASAQTDCTAAGGTWNGATSDTGTCTYGPKDDKSKDNCRISGKYRETYATGTLINTHCTYTRGFGSSGSSTSNQDNTEPVTLRLGGGRNGYVTFGAGVCDPFQCTISAILPTGAKDALPDTTQLGMLYVRVAGSQSTAYRVCFNNPKAEKMAIFRYVNHSWIAITGRVTSTPICVSVAGDGAFYLGSG